MKNKSVGFYLSAVAAVLMLIGLPFYNQSAYAIQVTTALAIAVAVIEVGVFLVKGELANVLTAVNAVVASAAVIFSFSTQLDAIGYVMSGLFTFDQIQGFVTFAVLACIGWLLLVVASFTGVSKKN